MELLVENAFIIGENEFYRASRYKSPLVIMLINSEDRKAFDILESSIRKTDILQQLSPETIVVFLSHTNYEEAEDFLKKIKNKLELTYTMREFNGQAQPFLEKLFIENEERFI